MIDGILTADGRRRYSGRNEMRNLITSTMASLLCAALVLTIVPARADDGNPRYVSGASSDTGDCTNRFRPCRTLAYAIAMAGKGDSVMVAEG